MLHRLQGAIIALLLATAGVVPAAAASIAASPSVGSDVRFQEEWPAPEGTGEEVAPAEGVILEDVAPAADTPDEWGTEEAVAGDAIAEEVIPAEPVLDESGEQPLVEDEFSAFSMPGVTPDNLTGAVLGDIDAFWAGELAAAGRDYYAAGAIPVTEATYSSCGTFGPYDNPAAYCPLDDTVYYSIPLGQDIQSSVGDFAWITVLAHEWGHHVQVVLGITPELTIDRELQADCLAGAYAQRAQQQGFLQEGDVSEAVLIAMLSGDPVGLDEMAAGAHGSSDDRVTSFMQGYFNGATTCMAA